MWILPTQGEGHVDILEPLADLFEAHLRNGLGHVLHGGLVLCWAVHTHKSKMIENTITHISYRTGMHFWFHKNPEVFSTDPTYCMIYLTSEGKKKIVQFVNNEYRYLRYQRAREFFYNLIWIVKHWPLKIDDISYLNSLNSSAHFSLNSLDSS